MAAGMECLDTGPNPPRVGPGYMTTHLRSRGIVWSCQVGGAVRIWKWDGTLLYPDPRDVAQDWTWVVRLSSG